MVSQPLQSVTLGAQGTRIRPSFSTWRYEGRRPTTLRASPSIGIDLGTTNSVVAVRYTARIKTTGSKRLRRRRAAVILHPELHTQSSVQAVIDGKPEIIPQRDGQEILPSILSFLEDGSVLVGNRAKRLGPHFVEDGGSP